MSQPLSRSRPPWWVIAATVSFCAYFAVLMYCEIWRAEDPGFQADFTGGQMIVTSVVPDSPGARAGLHVGDIISAADHRPVHLALDWKVVDANVEFSRPIPLDLARNGQTAQTTLALGHGAWWSWSTWPGVFLIVGRAVQLVALVLAIVIILKRPDDVVARVGAWALASIGVFDIVLPTRLAAVWRNLPLDSGFLLWLPHVSSDLAIGAIVFTFFASFPRKLIRSAWMWVAIWLPLMAAIARPMRYAWLSVYAPERASAFPYQDAVVTAAILIYTAGGLAALVVNYRRLADVNERRRIQVLVAGAVGGLIPGLAIIAYFWLRSTADVGASILVSPFASIGSIFLLSFPLSFAYAILRHRLFDIPTVLRQGVRYALARRVLEALVPVLAIVLIVDVTMNREQGLERVVRTRGAWYVAIGGLIVYSRFKRQQWLDGLDRRFFREQYNAQQTLRRVAEHVRAVSDFDQIAARVTAEIDRALHPEWVALLLRRPGQERYETVSSVPAGFRQEPFPKDEIESNADDGVELRVPIVMAEHGAAAMIALGPKRSEEPYSREDADLLAVIASNLALLLERSRPPAGAAPPSSGECPKCGTCYDATVTLCEHDGERVTPLALPRLLGGRYRLQRRLGRGGLGTVYGAFDTGLDRTVAVKVIREDLVANADVARRFAREARLAASFVHPNVVTVHDFGTSGTRAFLVMELLVGETLRDRLSETKRIPASDALPILGQVCAAVDAAHQRGIVHRDLKPENIFLVQSNGAPHAKVLDFGVAKLLQADPVAAPIVETGAGALLGTLPYMAPEQLRGEDVQQSCDLWAITVIAHELLTGSHPFAPGGVFGASGDLTSAMRAFFSRALASDPGKRPQSASLLLADLERAL